eukprot:6244562-Amphidinium_carterae.1
MPPVTLLKSILCFAHLSACCPPRAQDLNGNLWSIVEPLGWVAIGLSVMSGVNLAIFRAYAEKAIRNHGAVDPMAVAEERSLSDNMSINDHGTMQACTCMCAGSGTLAVLGQLSKVQ